MAEDVSPSELEPELGRRRAVADAYRADELERERAEARHGRNRADVAEESRRAELDRTEREAQASANADLARMYREARAAGERTRITSAMARSGESRALRLEQLRALNLKVLVPVLLGFAAWSTTGVHHGAARLMGIDLGAYSEPMWWALWLLEPVLIGAVVWIIIARARLAASGGQLDPRAASLAIACLGTSILLNFSAAVPTSTPGTVTAGFGVLAAMLAHAIGPAGAAATAHLIGIVDESIANADPWTDHRGFPVPLLADMDLSLDSAPGSTLRSAPQSVPESAPESTASAAVESAVERPAVVWPLPVADRVRLPIIARPTASETAQRTTGDQGGRQVSKAPAKARPNKGTRIPAAARKAPEASPRSATDEELRARLDALIASGELTADAPVRGVQTALGVGFERAKRVIALPTESAVPGHLTLLTS